ncbi:TIGR03826 family flagellar region protein [Bacillus alveayuensis]|uniref:TIGR03826 family flagellar region protein n=1 Tax=Aeribacillus alveayuensis TaxID=279215 RepID=UPI0005D113CD|nr:TIGR03826 family flagellar region protein [Bacillus alveayuensis]
MGELANCSKCHALFIKTKFRDICDACYKEEEKAFETVYNFLRKRENRTATLTEVVKGTGVSEELILKFIRQRRIQLTHYPNLGYSCEKCGTIIREGKLCENCTMELKREIERLHKYNEEKSQGNRQATYYSFDPEK